MSDPIEPTACPFCGKLGVLSNVGVSIWAVRCSNEECVSRRPHRSNASAAIEAWNRRGCDCYEAEPPKQAGLGEHPDDEGAIG